MTNPFLTWAYWQGVVETQGPYVALFVAMLISFALVGLTGLAATWAYADHTIARVRIRLDRWPSIITIVKNERGLSESDLRKIAGPGLAPGARR